MLRFLLIIFLTITFHSINGQALDSLLVAELYTFRDSNLIAMKNARHMIFKYIDRDDSKKVQHIVRYINKKLNPRIYRLFSDSEMILINYYIENYDPILQFPLKNEGYYSRHVEYYHETWSGWYDGYNDIEFRSPISLDAVMTLKSDLILSRISKSDRTSEEKAFLSLYYKYVLRLTNPQELEMEAVQFINAFPESIYNLFIKQNIRRWFTRGDLSWDAYFGGGSVYFSDGLDQAMDFHTTLVYGLDVTYERIVGGIRMSTSFGEVKEPFQSFGKTFTQGMNIYTFNYTLNIGYAVLDWDYIRIAPSIEFGGIYSSIPEARRDDFPEDPAIGAINYGFGGTIDIFPFQIASTSYYNDYLHRIGIRIHAGRLYNRLNKRDPLLDGYQEYLGISLIYDGGPMKLDLD